MNLRSCIARPIYRSLGIDIFSKARFVEGSLEWDPMVVNRYRLQKLNQLIDHCWANVPFYKNLWLDHGVKQGPLSDVSELSRFPTVSRAVLNANRENATARNIRDIPHKSDSTGGTTGEPFRYLHDLDLHALRYGFQLVGWGFADYRFGDPVFLVAGGSLMPGKSSVRNRVRAWLENKAGLFCLQMDEQLAVECWNAMLRQKTKIVTGYPSTIAILCTILKNRGLAAPKHVKAVITTAEMLQPQYRTAIESYFTCKVFDHFGCNDGGLLSYECELHEGFHYNDLECILEADQNSELHITNLWNTSMPFIRYANGDRITLAPGSCNCGRRLPRISRVEGRTGDILTFSNGKSLTPPGVTLLFKDLPIQAWQVVQTGDSDLEVRFLGDSDLSETHTAQIRNVLQHHLTPAVAVEIRRVEELAVTKGGKLKPVFREYNA